MKVHNIIIKILSLFVILVIAVIQSCGEYVANSPIEKDNVAPAPIFNAVVENLPGAALISYSLPSDDDLLYVLARYTNKDGKIFDFRSSYYTNRIMVEGFGDMNEYTINLYAVDRSENKSAPLAVKINPLESQANITARSLDIKPDFGGMSFTFSNDSEADLAFVILTKDLDSVLIVAETFFTSRASAKFAVRGYDAEPRLFGVVVRDKWGNLSDTIFKELIPIYEIRLDKSLFRPKVFPNDAPATHWGGSLEYIWDDIVSDKAAHTGNDATTEPKHISFDLGVNAKLSRINLKTIPDDKHWYNDVSPRFYEVWGSLDPDPSGSLDSWIKLATVENIKPSGLSIGTITEDDREAGRNGDDFDIPIEMPQVRYLRIRSLRNWSGNSNMCISEITVGGNDT